MTVTSSSPPAYGEQQLAAPETPLVPILNRTLPGPCHAANHDTLTWGPDGLLAYACHNVVVVVDPATVQVLQCLAKHKSAVCKLSWATQLRDRRLGLASADTSGVIISWDVASGEQMRAVSEGNLEIQDLAWVGPGDSAHLLAVHPPNHLVMWDMASGSKIWKKSYGDTILGFDVSPFKRDTLLLRCQRSFLLTEFSVDKSPKSDGKMFYLANSSTRGASVESGPAAGERGSIPVTEKRPRNKLRRMVRSIMLGEGA